MNERSTSDRRSFPGEVPYKVAFRPTMSHRESLVYAVLILIGTLLSVRYFVWWFQVGHLPGDLGVGAESPLMGASWALVGPFLLLTLVELVRVVSSIFLWVFALFMEDPLPMKPQRGMKVAVLTTIVPTKEPIEIVERMLRAARHIRYEGQVDLWLLDEGDDDTVKAMCKRLGVNHFTRKGFEKWNQPSGPFRAKTKAGNHNAWRDAHEDEYDLVGQMDPDHIPYDTFLERTLGYFRDPDVGYVVSPQIYGNYDESWLARGSDEQAFIFHGVIQRGANGFGMPILIGTNHVYRPAAMQSAGGYLGLITEDHATGLAIVGEKNPDTGNHWKGIYVPEAVSIGDGPISWADYLSQQMRWAYGMFEIIRDHDFRLMRKISALQAVGYLMLQSYYGFAALVFLGGNILTFLYLAAGLTSADMDLAAWWWLWLPQFLWGFVVWYWLQRFYLYENERGSNITGYVMTFACLPIFAQAAFAAFTGRSIPYVVTAKGAARTVDTIAVFRLHMGIAAVGLLTVAASYFLGNDAFQLRIWGVITVVSTGAFPVGLWLSQRWAQIKGEKEEEDPRFNLQARLKRKAPDLVPSRPTTLPPMSAPRSLTPAFAEAAGAAGPRVATWADEQKADSGGWAAISTETSAMAWPRGSSPAQGAVDPWRPIPGAGVMRPGMSRAGATTAAVAWRPDENTDRQPTPFYSLWVAVALLGLAWLAVGGVFEGAYPRGFDIFAHLLKIENLSAGLNPYGDDWFDGWYGGFHQFALYPYLSYLPAATLAHFTGDPLQATKIQIFATSLLAGGSMYLACRELLGQMEDPLPSSRTAALAGAVAFAFSPALLSVAFARGEVTDFTGMAFAPLSLLVLFRAVHKPSAVLWVLYGVTLAIALLIHPNTVVYTFGAGLIWYIMNRRWSFFSLGGLLLSLVVMAGVSAFWALPFQSLSGAVGDLESRDGTNLSFELRGLLERHPGAVFDPVLYVGVTTLLFAAAGLMLGSTRRAVIPFLAMAAVGCVIGAAWLGSVQQRLPFLNDVDADNGILLVILGLSFSVAYVTDGMVGRSEKPFLAHMLGAAIVGLIFIDLSISSGFARSDLDYPQDLRDAGAYVAAQDLGPLERTTTISVPENFAQLAYLAALYDLDVTSGYEYQSSANGGINYFASNLSLAEGRGDEALGIFGLFNTRFFIVDQLSRPEAVQTLLATNQVEEEKRFGRWLVLSRVDEAGVLRALGDDESISPLPYTIESYRPDDMTFGVRASGETTVLTPVSWSPVWTVDVDGEPVEVDRYSAGTPRGGFIAFPVSSGTHDVRMHIEQTSDQKLGIIISLVSVCAILAFLALVYARRAVAR
ncbi:MAG: glycosyltransferase family 2 protein [Dehalococcoidia bacterium]